MPQLTTKHKYQIFNIAVLATVGAVLVATKYPKTPFGRAFSTLVENIPNVIGLVIFAGLLYFVYRFVKDVILGKPTPRSQAIRLLAGWYQAYTMGDYARAQAIVDHAMEKLPIWDTQMVGMAVYLQMGNFEKAIHIAQQAIQERAQLVDELDRELAQPVLGTAHCLLANIYMAQQKFEQAETHIEQSLEYDFKFEEMIRGQVMACFALHQGDAENALPYLEEMEEGHRKYRKSLTHDYFALKAWAAAQQGSINAADQAMKEAFAHITKNHRPQLSEMYVYQGYVDRELARFEAARTAFEKAIEHDPEGLNGIIARRELQALALPR